jgi:hypothetical protein
MSDISTFIAAAGGVASIQTGFSSAIASTGTSEDAKYVDVPITAVDVNKSIPSFVGGNASSEAWAYALTGATQVHKCSARLTSSTNLRISTTGSESHISGRWYVVEFN